MKQQKAGPKASQRPKAAMQCPDWDGWMRLLDPVGVSTCWLGEPMVAVLVKVHVPVGISVHTVNTAGGPIKQKPILQFSGLKQPEQQGWVQMLLCMSASAWAQHVRECTDEGRMPYAQGFETRLSQSVADQKDPIVQEGVQKMKVHWQLPDAAFFDSPEQQEYLQKLHQVWLPYVQWYKGGQSVEQLQQYIAQYQSVYRQLMHNRSSDLLLDMVVRGAGDPDGRLGVVWDVGAMLPVQFSGALAAQPVEQWHGVYPAVRVANVQLQWDVPYLEQQYEATVSRSTSSVDESAWKTLSSAHEQWKNMYTHIQRTLIDAFGIGQPKGALVLMGAGAQHWCQMVMPGIEVQSSSGAFVSALQAYHLEQHCPLPALNVRRKPL